MEFKSWLAAKGQVLANFVAELTLFELSEQQGGRSSPWTLFIDWSANENGSGAGLLLITPEDEQIEYALRFSFPTSSNEAEYEALLPGLQLAKAMGVGDTNYE